MQQTPPRTGAQSLGYAVVGVLFLFVSGFAWNTPGLSSDPELAAGLAFAAAGVGLLFVIAAGVALGLRVART